ncbi:dehydrogenase [Corynespora cassiicola Philippines]|uniref:Dehydrogenase n=1 Tax=Corynespora cassiicola Philippines TaxID=1448308 RepID=A0A2T2N8R6_CORCC|nr:dehydrogenase [Corynespora cassiicola Philippines]
MMGGFLGFCYRQLRFKPKPLAPFISLEGKTALITGANSGLGFEAARELVEHNLSRLIIAVRDVAKGKAAKEAILESVPSSCEIEVWELDYESYYSIVEFSEQIASLHRLDYTLLSAGVKKMQYSTSTLGHESNVQVNHIGTSAVSLSVLPVLQKTAQMMKCRACLTIVSSESHFWIPFNERMSDDILERMDEKETFGRRMQRYNTTKLLNVLWVRELASKMSTTNVVINAVNPGFCHSGLHGRGSSTRTKILLRLLGWTSVQGGHCLTDALVQQKDSHGGYLSQQKPKRQVTRPSPFVLSAEGRTIQKKIWHETINLLKEEAPGVNTTVAV